MTSIVGGRPMQRLIPKRELKEHCDERDFWLQDFFPSLYEMTVGIFFFLIGLAWYINPSGTATHSPIGHQSQFQWYWSTIYVVCCPLAIFARLKVRVEWRAMLLCMIGSAMLMQGVVAVSSNPVDPRSYSYSIGALACFLRLVHIFKLRRKGMI